MALAKLAYRRVVFRVVNAVFALLFVVAAALQYNDPDPLGWTAIYLAAAACCIVALLRPKQLAPSLIVGAIAIVWAAILTPEALAVGELAHIAESMKATRPGIEIMREVLGLCIVAVWMAVLAWRARRLVTSER
ncbi:MAG TPA: transmembrane 220 family protein [Polyangiaceae bacterium]|nr:transmembrane 220 family protein [Polyangiaceae bacterium]